VALIEVHGRSLAAGAALGLPLLDRFAPLLASYCAILAGVLGADLFNLVLLLCGLLAILAPLLTGLGTLRAFGLGLFPARVAITSRVLGGRQAPLSSQEEETVRCYA
jgi:hypothetical protein